MLPLPGTSKLGLALSLLLAACMWFYVQYVLIGHQQAEAALHGIPRGNLSDLYPRWLGAHELLLHHRDPYSTDVTREIQVGYYGRAIDPSRPNDPTDEQGFAYPVYVVFLLAPTIWLPFPIVQVGFRWFLIALTGASVLLWLRTLRWRLSPSATAVAIVLTLGSFPGLQGIKLQQLSLLVGGLIAGCAVLLVEGQLTVAGVLLALASIKPQVTLPLSAWLLFWAFNDWRQRKNFVWGFCGTIAALVVAGELVLPGWIGRFRQAVIAYRRYNNGAGSVLDELVTPGWGRALALAIVIALAITCWRRRFADKDSSTFPWITVLVLAVTVVVIPKAAPYNQVLLLPGVLLIVRDWRMLWVKSRLTRACIVAAGVIVGWPWIAACALTLASLFLPPQSVQKGWAAPVYTSLAIPLAVAVLLMLYASRFEQAHAPRQASA